MVEVKVGKRGRLTLPKEVRKSLGIVEGDTIVIEPRGNGVLLKPEHRKRVRDVKGIAGIGEVDLEEIEEAPGKE